MNRAPHYHRSILKKILFVGTIGMMTALSARAAEPSVKANRPNILFAIADDMGHASAYGTPWLKTPHFDRVAAQGILFTNFYTPNAKCSPSRACILTGRNPWQNMEAANHWASYPPELKSWVEALADSGYYTGYTGKGWAPGYIPPEREMLTGKSYNSLKLDQVPTVGISNIDYTGNFHAFLKDVPKGEPFCFWYGGFEPHRGFGPRPKNVTASVSVDRVPPYWPETYEVREDMLNYAFEIEYFDARLGEMLATLEEQGLLNNTLVVVTSDNGPAFPRMKGSSYEASCRMPAAIMWKNGLKSTGRTSAAFCSFIDFAPTFLEVAGVKWDATGMLPLTGRSLSEIFNGNDLSRTLPERETLLLGRERNLCDTNEHNYGYPIRAMRKDQYLYLHNFEPDRWPYGHPEFGMKDCDGGPTTSAIVKLSDKSPLWQLCFGKKPREELYDVSKDPDCVVNLAENPEHKKVRDSMREGLFAELKKQEDPRMAGQGDIFDNYPSGKDWRIRAKRQNKTEPTKE